MNEHEHSIAPEIQDTLTNMGIQFNQTKFNQKLNEIVSSEGERNAYIYILENMIWCAEKQCHIVSNSDGTVSLLNSITPLNEEQIDKLKNNIIHDVSRYVDELDEIQIQQYIMHNTRTFLESSNNNKPLWQTVAQDNVNGLPHVFHNYLNGLAQYYQNFLIERDYTGFTDEQIAILQDQERVYANASNPHIQEQCLSLFLASCDNVKIKEELTLSDVELLINQQETRVEVIDERFNAFAEYLNSDECEVLFCADPDEFYELLDVRTMKEAMEERNKIIEYLVSLPQDVLENSPIGMLSNVGCTLDVLADFEAYRNMYQENNDLRLVTKLFTHNTDELQPTASVKVALPDYLFMTTANHILHHNEQDFDFKEMLLQTGLFIKDGLVNFWKKIFNEYDYPEEDEHNNKLPQNNWIPVKLLNKNNFFVKFDENQQYIKNDKDTVHKVNATQLSELPNMIGSVTAFMNDVQPQQLANILEKNITRQQPTLKTVGVW